MLNRADDGAHYDDNGSSARGRAASLVLHAVGERSRGLLLLSAVLLVLLHFCGPNQGGFYIMSHIFPVANNL